MSGEFFLQPNAAAARVLGAVISITPATSYQNNSGFCVVTPFRSMPEANGLSDLPGPNVAASKRRIIPAHMPLTYSSVPVDDLWTDFVPVRDGGSGNMADIIATMGTAAWESVVIYMKGLNNATPGVNGSAFILSVAIHMEYIQRVDNLGYDTMSTISDLNPPHNQAMISRHEAVLRAANQEGAQPLDVDSYAKTIGGTVEHYGALAIRDVASSSIAKRVEGALGGWLGESVASQTLVTRNQTKPSGRPLNSQRRQNKKKVKLAPKGRKAK